MTCHLQLTRSGLENVEFAFFGVYRLRVEVTDYQDIDPNIFIYQRGAPNPHLDGEPCDFFVGIAGPPELAELPIGEPDPDQQYPFYRLSSVELDFRRQETAEEVWQLINSEATVLCQAMNAFQSLIVVEEVWVPDRPIEDSEQ